MSWAPLNIARALTDARPVLDLVLPGLPVGTVGNLVAPGATGKTQFLLQLAVSRGLGLPALGGLFPAAQPENVLFLAAEEQEAAQQILAGGRLHAQRLQCSGAALRQRVDDAAVRRLGCQYEFPVAQVRQVALRAPDVSAARRNSLQARARLRRNLGHGPAGHAGQVPGPQPAKAMQQAEHRRLRRDRDVAAIALSYVVAHVLSRPGSQALRWTV